MTFTRARDLIAAAVVAGVLVNLVLQLSYGAVPRLPQPAGTSLLIFAIAEGLLGNALRARIRQRPGSRPVQALAAAKAVVLAKASSLASAASDTIAASIGAVCAAALVAAALWLEHCCRTPEDPDEPPRS